MISDLPDLDTGKSGKRKREGTSFFTRRARVSFPAPNIIPDVSDVTANVIKKELHEAVKNLAFTALEKTLVQEKQAQMRQELNGSQALSVMSTDYASLVDNLPQPLAIALLIGQKYIKVALT